MRTKEFRKRVQRFLALRRAGINTLPMARAAGTPLITYGVDAVGMSDSLLAAARRLVARAASAAAGGKSLIWCCTLRMGRAAP